MPSDRKKKAKEVKASKAKTGKQDDTSDQDPSTSGVTNGIGNMNLDSDRSCTGVLASHPQSRDIHVDSFSLLFHGHVLLQDTRLELNFGRRYGLLGLNGCGKSCLLKALAAREVPIPPHIDM
jgi:ATP-binding cassette subfamily F protein 2